MPICNAECLISPMYDAVLFDLFSALMDSRPLWHDVAGSAAGGREMAGGVQPHRVLRRNVPPVRRDGRGGGADRRRGAGAGGGSASRHGRTASAMARGTRRSRTAERAPADRRGDQLLRGARATRSRSRRRPLRHGRHGRSRRRLQAEARAVPACPRQAGRRAVARAVRGRLARRHHRSERRRDATCAGTTGCGCLSGSTEHRTRSSIRSSLSSRSCCR